MKIDFATLAMALSLSNVLQAAVLFAQTKVVRKYSGGGWRTMGIACACAGSDFLFDDLVVRTDRALYLAKEGGCNRIAVETDLSLILSDNDLSGSGRPV